MLRAELEKVFIEHCVNCRNHSWCTSHDEEKYSHYFISCKNAIQRVCLNITVMENEVPLGFTDKFITDPILCKPGRFHFPRIGSFEVYFRGAVVYSKIATMKWPSPMSVAEKIKEIQDAPPAEIRTNKKIKQTRLKSAVSGKKKKSKKGKKQGFKLNSRKKVKIPRSNGDDQREEEEDSHLRNNSEFYRHPEIPNFSVSESQHSDYEQPVPPPDSYKLQGKPVQFNNEKTPPTLEKEQPKQDLAKKTVTPAVQEYSNQKVEKPTALLLPKENSKQEIEKKIAVPIEKPQSPEKKAVLVSEKPKDQGKSAGLHIDKPQNPEKKAQILKNSSSSEASNKRNSNDPQHYSSEDYESNSEAEKFNFAEHLQNFPKDPKSNPTNQELHLSSKSPKESNKKGSEYSEDEDYFSENYEKYDHSSDVTEQKFVDNAKKFIKPSESPECNPDSSNNSSDKPIKADHQSSDHSEYEEEFEENEEDEENEEIHHPIRKVDKSYNVKLPLAEECKKKITYQNLSDGDAEFIVASSHPDFMSVKEPEVYIKKGQKGKIQLRFAPVFNGDEQKYYLYIDREGEPWECIEIVAEYEE